MNQLPKSAAELLEQARRSDRERRVDVEASLAALHGSLPFVDADLPSLPGEAGTSATLTTSLSPGGVATNASSGAWLGAKAIKLFLVAAVAGTIGGGALWGVGRSETAATSGARAGGERRSDATVRPGAPSWTRGAAAEPDPSAAPAPAAVQGAASRKGQPDTVASAAAAGAAREGSGSVQATSAHAGRAAGSVTASVGVQRKSSARAWRARDAQPQAARVASAQRAGVSQSQDAARAENGSDTEQAARVQPASEAANAVRPAGVQSESELDLIDAALRSLGEGHGARALSLLEMHRTRYPDGKFTTEREGLRVLALCAAGRLDEGRAAREAFLRRVRDAPIVARVRRACDEEARGP